MDFPPAALIDGVHEQKPQHRVLGVAAGKVEQGVDVPQGVVVRLLDVNERLVVEQPDAFR